MVTPAIKPFRRNVLILSYHYVEESAQYDYPGIHPITFTQLEEQLDIASSYFDIIRPAKLVEYFESKSFPERPLLLITFDDGLRNHRQVAEEVLEPRGIKAVFFVSTMPLTDNIPATTHLIHWLRATTSPNQFSKEIKDNMQSLWDPILNDATIRHEACSTYVNDDPDNAILKYFLSFILSDKQARPLIEAMLLSRSKSNSEFVDEWYMSTMDLLELSKQGHLVGGHGHTHTFLSRLDFDQQVYELTLSKKILEEITGSACQWIAYPGGTDKALPENLDHLLHKSGYECGFTMLSGWVEKSTNKVAINRVRCNDLYGYIN